jgi:hypothetical protein
MNIGGLLTTQELELIAQLGGLLTVNNIILFICSRKNISIDSVKSITMQRDKKTKEATYLMEIINDSGSSVNFNC